MEKDNYFAWSDSWVVAGILWTVPDEAEIDLSSIIRAGDMLNHAVYTPEELKTGFLKAQKKGLITIDRGRIKLTAKAKEIKEKVSTLPGGLFSIVDKFHRILNSKRTKLADVDDESVDACDFINAGYEEYRRRRC